MRDRLRACRPPSIAWRDPLTWILGAFALAALVGCWWNIPCTDAWSNDELAPRASTLGAVFETWRPGSFFRYPPLHGLLLFVLQLPVLLVAVARADALTPEAITREAMAPAYMTPALVLARLVAFAMAAGVILHTHRLWSRLVSPRAGLAAAALTATNPILVYYSRATSVDVPYWFWMTWAFVELDRVAAGEARERHAMLLVTAAVLTKDQPAFALLGAMAVTLVAVPAWGAPRGRRTAAVLRPALLRAGLLAAGIYLLLSGALVNPTGFRRKLAFMTGQGNQGWTQYERTFLGALEQLEAIGHAASLYGSRLVPAVAVAGLVFAVARVSATLALRRMAPLVAAASYFALFVIPSRWTMERHLMPLALLLFPYAGVAFDAALGSGRPWLRRGAWALAVGALASSAYDIACVDGSLVADARGRATDFLRALPAGTRVEVYGGNQHMPHLPTHLALARVGPEPLAERSGLPGVTEVVGTFAGVEARRPDYIVVSESVLRSYHPLPETRLTALLRAMATDPDGHPYFAALAAERLPYRRVLRARCELPWPLACRRINFSTGAELWIYRRVP